MDPAKRGLDKDATSNRPQKEASGWKLKLEQLIERADDYQQEHRFVAIPLAVWRKFSDDDGASWETNWTMDMTRIGA